MPYNLSYYFSISLTKDIMSIKKFLLHKYFIKCILASILASKLQYNWSISTTYITSGQIISRKMTKLLGFTLVNGLKMKKIRKIFSKKVIDGTSLEFTLDNFVFCSKN